MVTHLYSWHLGFQQHILGPWWHWREILLWDCTRLHPLGQWSPLNHSALQVTRLPPASWTTSVMPCGVGCWSPRSRLIDQLSCLRQDVGRHSWGRHLTQKHCQSLLSDNWTHKKKYFSNVYLVNKSGHRTINYQPCCKWPSDLTIVMRVQWLVQKSPWFAGFAARQQKHLCAQVCYVIVTHQRPSLHL